MQLAPIGTQHFRESLITTALILCFEYGSREAGFFSLLFLWTFVDFLNVILCDGSFDQHFQLLLVFRTMVEGQMIG